MQSSIDFNLEYSCAFEEALAEQLQRHLIREDGQEDLVFILWTPSLGRERMTALIHRAIFPERGDRAVHGNASFNLRYLERVCSISLKDKAPCGIGLAHSHPGPGWQDMSPDDVVAERDRLATVAHQVTGLPLVGLTVGSDGTWSGRFWNKAPVGHRPERHWMSSIRTVGKQLKADFCDSISFPKSADVSKLLRTITIWGERNHEILSRLHFGIVGLGSVGSIVAECLARMGMGRITLIDYDEVQLHNLDRILGASSLDIGKLKVDVVSKSIGRSATNSSLSLRSIPYSVAEKEGYAAALDCDLIFSCVDRPRARRVLNHLAYAHLIPVVDGGICAQFKHGGERFARADWQLQTASPGRPCLDCLGVYDPSHAALEAAGKLDDPSYISGLPDDHVLKSSENIFFFSMNLASLEIMQAIALVTGIGGVENFGVQRFRYVPGVLESDTDGICSDDCVTCQMTAEGDRHLPSPLFGVDHGANEARRRQNSSHTQGYI